MGIRHASWCLALCAVACSPRTPPPATPTRALVPDAAAAPLPRSPDVREHVMAWLLVHDGERLARQLTPSSGANGANAANGSGATPPAGAALLASLGLNAEVARLIDLERPFGLGVLNPSLLATGGVQPFVALVPVRTRAEVERTFAAHAPLDHKPWGFSVATSPTSRMYVAFRSLPALSRGHGSSDYVVVAWRADLLEAAWRLLGPRLGGPRDAPVTVHVQLDNVYDSYGPQLQTMLGEFAFMAERGGKANDPQVAYALRGIRQLSGYLGSVADLELLADLDPGGLTLTVRADGKDEGAFSGFVQEQQPGPAWGVQYLPRDAVLAYATHSSPHGRAVDIGAAIEYLAAASPHHVDVETRERWRHAFQRATLATNGELAYAVWPARDGGLGLGGAYRVRDPAQARAAVSELYAALTAQIGSLVARALLFDPGRFASRTQVARRSARIGDVDVDLVEVSIHWPRRALVERHVFEAMFGKRLTMATAFVGGQALFAIGADYEERLATMIGTAHAVAAGASLGDEPGFAAALAYHPEARVSLSYLDTARMARFAAGLVQQSGGLDQQQQANVERLLQTVGRGAIISTTNARGRRYEVTTHVPHSAMLGVAALDGALWRIALSPLLNPPMMPPMPLPPPHVTPRLRQIPAPTPSL